MGYGNERRKNKYFAPGSRLLLKIIFLILLLEYENCPWDNYGNGVPATLRGKFCRRLIAVMGFVHPSGTDF